MKCDIAVVGSGIGGLCAAALLTKAGYKTVILEKQAIIGGRYTTIDYKGYLVTSAAIYVNNFNGSVVQVLKEVGILSEVEMRMPKPFLKYRIGGKDYEVPERGGVMRLISAVSKSRREEERVSTAFRRALNWQEPSDEITFGAWLSNYTDNEDIHKIWNGLSCTLGCVELDEIPAGAFVRLIKMFRVLGSGYLWPRRHCKDVVDALARRIKEGGGEILTKTKVSKIKVVNGVVEGVLAEQEGKALEVDSRVVLSNAPPWITTQLAGKGNFDEGYLRDVGRGRTPTAGLVITFECDRPLMDFPGVINVADTKMPCSIMDPSLTWPEYAPEGKHCLWLWQPVSMKFRDMKEELDAGVEHCRENLHDFDKYSRVLVAQSFSGDWPVNLAAPGFDIGQKTPIENLYNIGDGVKPYGYVMGEGAAESARIVVKDIRKRLQPA